MARYKAILIYEGTGFQGSQRQAGLRTVQGELEAALQRLGWTGRSVFLAGRTDRGVHAEGQVAAFDLDWRHDLGKLQKALNAELPPDLAVRELVTAPDAFHPRFDARSREYAYRLFSDPLRQPLRERFAWRVWPEPDGRILAEVARLLPGTHDFRAFGSAPSPQGSTQRTVTQAQWHGLPGREWRFDIHADAFLYRMVRRLVHVQVSAAQGRVSPHEVGLALNHGTNLPAGIAPAHGLTLVGVRYGSN